MAKIKTSKKQKRFSIADMPIVKLKKGVKTTPFSPTAILRDRKFVAEALYQCLIDGDDKGFKEIMAAHIRAKNLSRISRDSGVSLRAIHIALSPSGNPTLGTLAKIMRGVEASKD